MDRIRKLEREIEELEKKIQKDHFGSLFDPATRKKDEARLKKLKKELERLQKEGRK